MIRNLKEEPYQKPYQAIRLLKNALPAIILYLFCNELLNEKFSHNYSLTGRTESASLACKGRRGDRDA